MHIAKRLRAMLFAVPAMWILHRIANEVRLRCRVYRAGTANSIAPIISKLRPKLFLTESAFEGYQR